MHQAFELVAGSGVIGQRHVGLVPAAALSLVVDVGGVAGALDTRRGWHRLTAAGAGAAFTAAPLHYTLFPWRSQFGVPVLVQPEGLRGPAAAGYVSVLYVWATAGIVAIAEVPRGRRRWFLAGVAVAIAFRQLGADHVMWVREEARRNPQWWNRAWRAAQP